MSGSVNIIDRRTAADMVFDRLEAEILSLELLPGTKLSEAEVAKRFGVSRQPVRKAFDRLSDQGLLLVRPQRASEVRGFSMSNVDRARFLRLAVELEVFRRACTVWDNARDARLRENLDAQAEALERGDAGAFHALDYEFHLLVCRLSGCDMAALTIRDSKKEIDRLCQLSLEMDSGPAAIIEDHRAMADALLRRSETDACRIIRLHLTRIESVIQRIREAHSEYFE